MREGEVVSVIAEVKRRSPGAGEIRPHLEPGELAAAYEAGGARALSVLTDAQYFGGSLDDLVRAREAVALPTLRKDFLLAEVQVHEARAAGADAILLIVRALDDPSLRGLRELAEELGMSALVEVHDRAELERALESGATVVGINNRDLATFETSIQVTLDLASEVPGDRILVSESGIGSGEEVARLGRGGVDAVLVGGSLLSAREPGRAVTELVSHPRVARPYV